MSELKLPEALQTPELFREQCHVNGGWRSAASGARLAVDNPATGEIIGHVPSLDADEITAAIEGAEAAFVGWRALTAEQRGNLLYRWYELMLAHQDDLALLMTLEQGKPLAESAGEIAYAASFLKWFAEEARRSYGDVIPAAKPGQHIVVIKQPVGVVAAITPWNFPSSMITRKAGAALAAGCPIVVKPASATPFSALALAELAQRAGIPDGVFNVVTGSAGMISDMFTCHSGVRKISFTGSTEVGRKLMAQAATHVQKVSLELGGNAPFIVFEDADLDAAVEGAIVSKFRNTGQTCVCVNRFLVQSDIHDAFVAKLRKRLGQLKIGPGLEPGVHQAPLINAEAVDKVLGHVEDALARGAKLEVGGKRHALGGNFVEPTLMTGVTPAMQVCREETFGPLVAVTRFETEQEAIALANDTPFGLAAYFYARDIQRVWRVAEALEAGMIGINEGLISNAAAPFGGVKESGLGREGSRYGMDEYLEVKYLCMG